MPPPPWREPIGLVRLLLACRAMLSFVTSRIIARSSITSVSIMSNASSSAGAWFTRLEPASAPILVPRPDDPRLGECVTFWREGEPELRAGRPVLVGFPQDEGVHRNRGRPGAAGAPAAIR